MRTEQDISLSLRNADVARFLCSMFEAQARVCTKNKIILYIRKEKNFVVT